jgi:hypothetical protein
VVTGLLIDRHGDGYWANVLRSPAGDGQAVTFAHPFSDLELENFLLKMGRSRGRMRRIESAPVAAAKEFGGRLFATVFTGQVRECLRRSVDRAQDEDATLRIRLRLSGCPELARGSSCTTRTTTGLSRCPARRPWSATCSCQTSHAR